MAADVKEYIPSVDEKPRVVITSDKFKQKFTVTTHLTGPMYKVNVEKGSVPAKLAGYYTDIDKAVDAVLRYEKAHPGTQAVQRDEKHAAKVQRKHTEHVRKRTGDGEG